MPGSHHPPTIISFDPFEADLQTQELRKQGVRLHLPGQSFQILKILLERPGELATREELHKALWPSETFVDFEHGVNAAVNRLREVLGDSADTPHLIETLPRRGYRFIGTITQSPNAPGVSCGTDSSTSGSFPRLPGALSKRWVRVAGVALVVLAVASGVLFLAARWHRQPDLEIVPFTTLPEFESAPSFSPDGSQIAFAYLHDGLKRQDIFVKAIGDEKMLQLTEPPGRSGCPQWSPDGRLIAYSYYQPASPGIRKWAIYLMTPLGGARRKLLDVLGPERPNLLLACLASWSRDSKSVIYADKPSPDEPSGIFIADVADPKPRRLTAAPKFTDDRNPSISHDGKQLAFLRETDYATRDIYIVTVSGGAPRRLTFRKASVHRPTWTSDDKRILFTDAGGGFGYHNDLYSVPVSGGTPERLPFSNHDASDAAISAQGDKLLYVKGTFDANIWKVSLSDSAEPPTKFIASSLSDTGPDFSPDGSKIAFVADRNGSFAIWICNADGSNPMQLSEVRQGGTPRWSPDGRQIAFDSRGKGRSHIYIVPAEGGTPAQLTEDDFVGQVPSWSGDGNWIYFSSDRSGSWEIWKVSLRTKEAVQVTRHGGINAQESADGKFVYYDKPAQPVASWTLSKPGLWVMPVSGGPEKLILSDPDRFWHVRAEGIYYVVDAEPHPRVQLYRFATGKVTTVGHLDKPAYGAPGLAISPDGRALLYGQVDTYTSDLMLVKNGKW
jgi:Tol biopolymer transport system component/DNA-binding winged helix-turn-helix (wHTH) protein